MSGLKECLLGMGNPLLDVMSNVDQAFLDKYEVRSVSITSFSALAGFKFS